jgi:hypothetical protein
MKLGAQMYTLRKSCEFPDGIARNLEKVSSMGYQGVEVQRGSVPHDPLDALQISITNLKAMGL